MKLPARSDFFNRAYGLLNPAQKRAVDTIEGPVMVVAGPGTGKTQVLALRIANILLQTDTPAHAILALTFTESGAQSMRERLVEMIGPEGYYVTIGTFHAFCAGVIRDHPEKFALGEDAEPLSDLERIGIFTDILNTQSFKTLKPLNKPYLYVKSLIRTIQELKREGYTAQKFLAFLEKSEDSEIDLTSRLGQEKLRLQEKLREVSEMFALYEARLLEMERYDYEDMINLVDEAFASDELLLRSYQERYLYLLADEYQDTNTAQNTLLFQLASYWGPEANIFVVGDPDQSIYRFQGASLENILEFKKRFPTAQVIYLNHNYRSQQTVLDSAHALIQKNALKSSDIAPEVPAVSLQSQTAYPPENLLLGAFSTGATENAFIATQIKELVKMGVSLHEIAIIYRDNADATDIADLLQRMEIPYNLEGGDDVLHTGDVGRLLTMMRCVVGLREKNEDLDLFTLLNYDFLSVSHLDVLKLARFASEQQLNLLEAINDPRIDTVGLAEKDEIIKVLDQLQKWGQMDANIALTQLFETMLNDSGLLDWVMNQPDVVRRLNRLNSFFRHVKQLNSLDHGLNLKRFLHQIDLMDQHNLRIPEEDIDVAEEAVKLSTAHKIKGQEYEYVFICKAIDGKWGNRRVVELIKLPDTLVTLVDLSKKEKNEDERRLFYVSLTRAKKKCWITWAGQYGDKQTVPSMFVSEIPDELKQQMDTIAFMPEAQEILQQLFATVQVPTLGQEERSFIKGLLTDYKMSPTALSLYLECAYKFKLSQMLQTPRAKSPAQAYGTAMHKALEDFFRLYKQAQSKPSADFLVAKFFEALDDEILTDIEKNDWKRRGEEALRLYFDFYGETLLPPVATERFFGGKLHPVLLDDIGLSGKIDKVEWVDQKTKKVRVVDYKTGAPQSRNEIEGKTKYSDGSYKRQLVFYKLLASVDRSFGYSVVETQLDFIEKNPSGKLKRETFEITDEEMHDLIMVIKETMAKIRNLEFPRTTDYSVCAQCEFRRHCWPDGIPVKQSVTGEQLGLL